MKRSVFALAFFGMSMVTVCAVHAASTMTVIGRNPFYKPSLTSIEDLKVMMRDRKSDLQTGLALAGYPELFDALMAQFPEAAIEPVEISRGETLEWMLYKREGKGKVRLAKDVTWGGERPLPAFAFFVDKDGRRYAFVVPLDCGNLSLKGVSAVPPAKTVGVPPAPNQSPDCRLQVSPDRAFCGEPIVVDASASTDPDGSISSMTITVVDGKGVVAVEETVDTGPYIHEMAMPCGANTLKVAVTDNDGAVNTSLLCETSVFGVRRWRMLADIGFFRQFDPANYLMGRVGAEYWFTDSLSVMGLVGGAPKISGGDDGEDAFLIDAIVNYHWSQMFAGAGLGGWITSGDDDNPSENSQVDLIVELGARVYGEPETSNISLFIEGRMAPDELDDISKYGRFGIGARFRF